MRVIAEVGLKKHEAPHHVLLPEFGVRRAMKPREWVTTTYQGFLLVFRGFEGSLVYVCCK